MARNLQGKRVTFAALLGLAAFPTLVVAQSLAANPEKSRQGCPSRVNVGFEIVKMGNGLMMAVWFPTDSPEHLYSYSADVHGMVASDAEVSKCGRVPLVIFSHGLDGCGTQSIFITEELARRGYVVAAPDHKDATCHVDGTGKFALRPSERSFFKPETWTESTYRDRQNDIEEVISWFGRNSKFSPGVDLTRIGIAGHSTGGYVALGMAGGWQNWKDPRIKAALLFSPYALPFLQRKLLQNITVPIMFQGAQLDLGITPFLRGRSGAYAAIKSPKFYVELKGGNHFEWTNLLCLGSKTIAGCVSSKSNAQLIISYSAMFLDRFLKLDSSAPERLRGNGLAVYQHEM